MPGSPPTSTMLPGTMPPPSAKSNSARPDFQRGDSDPTTSPNRRVVATGVLSRALPRVADGDAAFTISSTSVFHSPHVSHLPAHLAYSAPHSVQRYAVRAFGLTAR